MQKVLKLAYQLAFAVATDSLSISEIFNNTEFSFTSLWVGGAGLGLGSSLLHVSPFGDHVDDAVAFAPATVDDGSVGRVSRNANCF